MSTTLSVLEVDELCVEFGTDEGALRAVDGVSIALAPGERVAVVGESGSGKTVTALAIMGLIEPPGRITAGDVRLDGRSLRGISEDDYRKIRGRDVAMVFQDPMTALNPALRVGPQVAEAITVHDSSVSRSVAAARAVEQLGEVGIASPTQRARDYPHQLSGGMRQRVLIAMALVNRPRVLIADEPTTALDVTTQAQILELLDTIGADRELAVVLVTHDLGVVAGHADRVVVMYAGRVVEEGTVDDVFAVPRHPYTRGLLAAVPTIASARGGLTPIPGSPPNLLDLPVGCPFHPRCVFAQDRCRTSVPPLRELGARPPRRMCPRRGDMTDLLDVDGVVKHFRARAGGVVRAVDGVTFAVARGETLALVGESGSGKSTIARLVLRLIKPTSGAIRFGGRRVQMVFQDPYASLDPRMTARTIVTEPLVVAKRRRDATRRVPELFDLVGLGQEHMGRFPHELSGGQRQRVGIARPSRSNRTLSCSTSPSALSTCRSRRRSSTCWRIFRGGSRSRICSSRTTSRLFAISPIESR